MARKISFRERVAECLSKSDASTFQSLFSNKLTESLDMKKIGIIMEMNLREENVDELTTITEISSLAKSFGSINANYAMGVLVCYFDNQQAVNDFTSKLDETSNVDSYETNEIGQGETGGPTDLEMEGDKPIIEVTVYLNDDIVNIVPESEYNDLLKQVMESKSCDSEEEEDDSEEEDDEEEDSKEEDDSEEEDSKEEDDSEEEDDKKTNESLSFDDLLMNEAINAKFAQYNTKMHKVVIVAKKMAKCGPGKVDDGNGSCRPESAKEKATRRQNGKIMAIHFTSAKRRKALKKANLTKAVGAAKGLKSKAFFKRQAGG